MKEVSPLSEPTSQAWTTVAKDWGKDLLIAVAIALVLKAGVADARKVPTPSMVPTVQVGDRIFVERLFYHFTGPKRGDIVVFTPPVPSPDDYLKRVIGLPGETVEVRRGQVLINGTALNEPYEAEAPRYTYGPVTVPEGKVLVLGDNRNQSYDSHSWGLLDISAIHGRAWVRYWPFERIGRL
jgi:signal peptidase I